jgi:hypothetical protein
MPDPSDDDKLPDTYVFPIPPRDGLLSRLSFRARATITTGEFAGALTCAAVAWSVGGDMTLTMVALFSGWVLGSIGIATVPTKSGAWRFLAVIGLLLIFAAEGGFLYWHFHGQSKAVEVGGDKPVPPTVQPSASSPPPVPQPRKADSTQSLAIYKCKNVGNPDRKTLEKNSADFKKYIEIYADTFGYKANILKVPGGDKAELTPAGPTGQKNMGSVTKIIFDVRRIGKDLIGIFSAEFEDNLLSHVYAAQPLIPDSSSEIRIRKRIEDLAAVEKGDCELQ